MSANHRAEPVGTLDVTAPNLLIVDQNWSVVIAAGTDIWERAGYRVAVGRNVPPPLQLIVGSTLDALNIDRSKSFSARISPWPDIGLTIYSVDSADQRLIALTAQPYRARRNLLHAQRTYRLSPRELDILGYVLGGSGTSEIAIALRIADSTVIAHVKSLLVKTKATNRAALVARVLGWEGTLIPEGQSASVSTS